MCDSQVSGCQFDARVNSESPGDARAVQPVLYVRIVRNVQAIVIFYKCVPACLPKDDHRRDRDCRQHQHFGTPKTVTRTRRFAVGIGLELSRLRSRHFASVSKVARLEFAASFFCRSPGTVPVALGRRVQRRLNLPVNWGTDILPRR